MQGHASAIDAMRCAEEVVSDTLLAIKALARSLGQASAGKASQMVSSSSDPDVIRLHSQLDHYASLLRRVARSPKPNLHARYRLASWLLLDSYAGRVCALARALNECNQQVSPLGIFALADTFSVWRPLSEPVRVRWEEKDKGGYRPIVSFGPMRRAQCLIVRDMLSVLSIDSPVDFSRKGGGGEKGLVKEVCDLIMNGYDWWWTPDIKSCFASIKPGHFGWLPIDRRLLKNVCYLPKCAEIEVVKPKDPGAILQSLVVSCSDLPVGSPMDELIQLTIQLVRRGLPQGSVLSPLLARALVGRILRAGLLETGAEGSSYCDDLAIGARTKKELGAARQKVMKAFSSLPAGALELHDALLLSARRGRVTLLGYRLEPGRGHCDNPIHVKPWRPRTDRFKARLTQRLLLAKPGADPFHIAEKYRRRWFNGQTAWTKVPILSDDISCTITMCYVIDFEHGEPMGGGELPKPTKPLLG